MDNFKLKIYKRRLKIFSLSFISVYFSFSFILMDANLFNWSDGIRCVMVLLTLLIFFVAVGQKGYLEDNI